VQVEELPPSGDGMPELISTPNTAAIVDICAFLKIQPWQDIKCVAYMGTPPEPKSQAGKAAASRLYPVVVFLRGDHQVNETKLNAIAGTTELRPMMAEELQLHIGGPAGYLGPVGIAQVMAEDSLKQLKSGASPEQAKGAWRENGAEGLRTIVVLDHGLAGRENLVCGANKQDYHFRNVTPGRDFTQTLTADVRSVNEGEPDPVAGEPLKIGKAVEIGHIFKLGYKYSKSMGASVLNRDGKETTPIMGSYGIGVERILTAAIEQSAERFATKGQADAYALPRAIAPFQVVVTVTNVREAALAEAGEKIARELDLAGVDVLLDDRDERAGVKFKDAELIGVPFRIAVGKKLAEGKVELLNRLTGEMQDVPLEEIVQSMKAVLSA
jgi:prolyl-tRNA synthetase